jgi:hypothetical protein
MSNFLKNFGLGIVYFLLLPLLIAVFALVGVYGLILWLYILIRNSIRFFKGERFFEPFSEDEKVQEIKLAQIDSLAHPVTGQTATAAGPAGPSSVYVQQNYYTNKAGEKTPETPSPNANNGPIDATGTFRPDPTLSTPAPSSPAIDASSQPSTGLPFADNSQGPQPLDFTDPDDQNGGNKQ